MMPWICCIAAELPIKTPASQKSATSKKYKDLDNIFSLYEPYLADIGPYKPVYFLLGADPKDSRFQISLKHQLFGDQSALGKSHEWVRGFHLGYTQTSSWDLRSDSAPFEDTSYQPEIFFRSDNILTHPGWLDGLYYQAAMQHESNGQAGDESRSTNYFYF